MIQIEDPDHAVEFNKRMDGMDYAGAYDYFSEHPDLVAGLSPDDVVCALGGFKSGGLDESGAFYKRVQEHPREEIAKLAGFEKLLFDARDAAKKQS